MVVLICWLCEEENGMSTQSKALIENTFTVLIVFITDAYSYCLWYVAYVAMGE